MPSKILGLTTLAATISLVTPANAQIPANIGAEIQRNSLPQFSQPLLDVQRNPQNFFNQGQRQLETEVQSLIAPDSNSNSLLVIREPSDKQILAIEEEIILQNGGEKSTQPSVPSENKLIK